LAVRAGRPCLTPDDQHLLVTALTGEPANRVRDWIRTAAVAHLLEWRHDALAVDIDPEDTVLPAGAEATRWVVDRFTHTALDTWQQSSLSWELAFSHDGPGVAARVGVALTILRERPISQHLVVSALAKRTTRAEGTDVVLGDMTAYEVLEHLVALVLTHDHADALRLVEQALHHAPDQTDLRLAWAFLLIAVDPAEARRRLAATDRVPKRLRGLHRVNLTAAGICEGDTSEQVLRQAADALDEPDLDAWLWDPQRLDARPLELIRTTTHAWAAAVLDRYGSARLGRAEMVAQRLDGRE
jgi:hypothetical protein